MDFKQDSKGEADRLAVPVREIDTAGLKKPSSTNHRQGNHRLSRGKRHQAAKIVNWVQNVPRDARTQSSGSASAEVSGTYTFRPELKHHVLARRSEQADCKGPRAYDCKHGDLLYVYQDAENQPSRALYLDSEGHVIHYTVSTPEPATALFISEASTTGPQFQLVHKLKDGVMSGKFQMRMPGQAIGNLISNGVVRSTPSRHRHTVRSEGQPGFRRIRP